MVSQTARRNQDRCPPKTHYRSVPRAGTVALPDGSRATHEVHAAETSSVKFIVDISVSSATTAILMQHLHELANPPSSPGADATAWKGGRAPNFSELIDFDTQVDDDFRDSKGARCRRAKRLFLAGDPAADGFPLNAEGGMDQADADVVVARNMRMVGARKHVDKGETYGVTVKDKGNLTMPEADEISTGETHGVIIVDRDKLTVDEANKISMAHARAAKGNVSTAVPRKEVPHKSRDMYIASLKHFLGNVSVSKDYCVKEKDLHALYNQRQDACKPAKCLAPTQFVVDLASLIKEKFYYRVPGKVGNFGNATHLVPTTWPPEIPVYKADDCTEQARKRGASCPPVAQSHDDTLKAAVASGKLIQVKGS